jgi:predicted amidophosphoribosyltransferase
MHPRGLTRLLDSILPLACPGCGCAVGASAPVCARCAPLLRPPPLAPPPRPVDAWWALLAYDGVARELVARVKYRRAHAVVQWLGAHMAALVGPPLPDVVTWAPTTAARRRERGFDHAALLAREVGRALQRPVRGLLRREDGPPQTGRPAHERRHGPRFGPAAATAPTVLLVDDVATTGATLAAAAASLLDAGAVRVVGLTAARTP